MVILIDSGTFEPCKEVISLELPNDSTNGIASNTTSFRGDFLYLSPEVLSSLEYSKSSDVYSFNVVMCGIMNDKSPFSYYSKTSQQISKVLTENYRIEINEST
ncbi:hypothetical protein M9Y10_029475 [Tritrichomonas musculus]|uniref:Protein kinase domain-containing protein n=1 Tax=Tritrichomonas musculus TaxID=1915356 RepID=A0ABR2KM95_9EUKA